MIDKDSGETAVFRGFGSGQDATDKTVMKAQTAALKYAYMLSLAIATGDDPEADEKTDESMVENKQNVSEQKPINRPPIVNQPKVSLNKMKMPKGGYICYDCGIKINERVAEYSQQKFGKYLFMECQKNHVAS